MSESLNGSAIQQIKTLLLTAAVSDAIKNTDCPAAAIPDGVELESLEAFNANRFRFRGALQTSSIADFVRYSIGFKGEGIRCFIDADKMAAKSIFNIGTEEQPGHADNHATLNLKKTAPFTALLGINGDRRRQKELAEWLEDWADYLTGFDIDGNVMSAKSSAAAVRRITIETLQSVDNEVGDFSGKKSVMESVEAKSKDIMPVAFEFKCVPYEGLNERAFSLRLSITASDTPVLTLRIVQLENVEEKIATEFRDLLNDEFDGTSIETFIGKFTS